MAAGVELTVTLDEAALAQIDAAFARLGSEGMDRLADNIGNMIADQTQRRISDEKTAPDGSPWAPWSESYAATRNTNNRRANSLLVGNGEPGLRESIQQYHSGPTIRVGSNLVYAAMHQFGGTKAQFPHLWGDIPARPYLGLSAEDRREIEDLVIDVAGAYLS